MASKSAGDQKEHIEGTLFSLISATASVVGADYFSTSVEHLADALEASSAFICEFFEGGEHVSVVACWPAQEQGLTSAFLAADSAGGATRNGAPVHHPGKVRQLFPCDPMLEMLALGSFLAVPVYGSTGRPNGFLGIGDEQRLNAALPAEAIMRLVAARAGAEIERMQAERQIREQSELLRMFSERSEDIILHYRILPTPAVEYVSPSFERITQYSTDEFYADPMLLLRMVHPDERDELQRVIAGDQDRSMLWRYITKNGETLWIDGRRIAIRNEAGQVVAYETMGRDVTAQRTAQLAAQDLAARQQFLLEAIPDSIVHVGGDGRILDHKPATGSGLPFTAEQPVGRHVSEIFPYDVVGLVLSRLALVFETQTTQGLRYRRGDDPEDRVYEARLAPAGADRAVILVRDITAADWMTKEEDRRNVRDELEVEAERRVDLRNPYNLTVREFTVLDLVARGAGDKQIATDLGISVFTVGKHVSNILGKMGVASRTEASVHAAQEGLLGG